MQGIFETKNSTEEQIRKYKRTEKELDPERNSNSRFAPSDVMEKIIKNCREVKRCNYGINRMKKEEQRENFRILLGFRENDITLTKEQSVLKSQMDAFEGKNMPPQYSVLGYKIDIYFHEYRLEIEVDEKGHKDRDINDEIQTQKALEKELGCEFIRINPDKESFNIFKAINEIHRHIKESIKKSTKKPFNVPNDLAKLSNIVKNHVVKKTEYDKLVKKVNGIDTTNFVLKTEYEKDKINKVDKKNPDVNDLVKKTNFNAKITKVEGKIPRITGLATSSALTAIKNKIPDVSSLVKKKRL